MAVDEALLEAAAAEGQCTLRFYGWEEPTLSLGYFQTYADRWQHEASSRSAVVRRNTGGGAILHDLELTYSFAVPDRHPLAIDRLGFYHAVHTTLIEVLGEWGIAAKMFVQMEGGGRKAEESRGEGREERGEGSVQCSAFSVQRSSNPQSPVPHSSSAFRPPPSALTGQPFLCFQRRSPGDVLVGSTKVAGSAQRRCRDAVLQHGSVLLARSSAAPELDGLKELTGKVIRPEELVGAWLTRLAGAWAIPSQGGCLSDAQRRRAVALATEKYASPLWTENRGRI